MGSVAAQAAHALNSAFGIGTAYAGETAHNIAVATATPATLAQFALYNRNLSPHSQSNIATTAFGNVGTGPGVDSVNSPNFSNFGSGLGFGLGHSGHGDSSAVASNTAVNALMAQMQGLRGLGTPSVAANAAPANYGTMQSGVAAGFGTGGQGPGGLNSMSLGQSAAGQAAAANAGVASNAPAPVAPPPSTVTQALQGINSPAMQTAVNNAPGFPTSVANVGVPSVAAPPGMRGMTASPAPASPAPSNPASPAQGMGSVNAGGPLQQLFGNPAAAADYRQQLALAGLSL